MLIVERKNRRIRKAMADAGIGQTNLATILGVADTEVSVMLKRELARTEQDEIIRAIGEWKQSRS